MTVRKSVPDMLLSALERTIADGRWSAAVSIAIELRQWRAAWSRLGLTEAETAVLDETVTATAPDDDCAADGPLKVGDRVRIVRAGNGISHSVGTVGDIAKITGNRYGIKCGRGFMFWCCRDQIERVEPDPERLKFGQWVRLPDEGVGIVLEDDGRSGKCYFVCLKKGRQVKWFHPDDLTPIDPQS